MTIKLIFTANVGLLVIRWITIVILSVFHFHFHCLHKDLTSISLSLFILRSYL